MHSLFAERTPGIGLTTADPTPVSVPSPGGPPRVIEIGEITAGIAVPEGRGVRFFSSARDFDGLDGTLFRTTEQATRAARERVRSRAHTGVGQDRARLRRA
ncbi:hypothetical protein MKK88_26410 [Methylobacterium sp. E-005]|uniref:hypothetical protein n=1 Tax=Methylobacterium sp. E-005 TaxID=2836549 RepID=UPI001FB937B1|nr:hypothetical protein [Methylobacterium sp. E-005]MCJ2089497.1 hypothetical protein [Methylobacterium sp. E-005]